MIAQRCSLSLAALEVIVQALQAFREDESWKTSEELIGFPKMIALAKAQRDVAGSTQDRIEKLMCELGDALQWRQLELPDDPPGLEVAIVVTQ